MHRWQRLWSASPSHSFVYRHPRPHNSSVYGRKWNALDADQIVEETTGLVTCHGLRLLWIVGDNFLVDRERALQIAEGRFAAG